MQKFRERTAGKFVKVKQDRKQAAERERPQIRSKPEMGRKTQKSLARTGKLRYNQTIPAAREPWGAAE